MPDVAGVQRIPSRPLSRRYVRVLIFFGLLALDAALSLQLADIERALVGLPDDLRWLLLLVATPDGELIPFV